MKILIPTAKEMSTKSKATSMEGLSEKSKSILKELLKLDSQSLAKIYKIKEHQVEKEVGRWQEIVGGSALTYPALHLFDGLMYRNIKRESLTEEEQDYLAKNVFITTSFYGIINVFDKISAHRLDFMQNIKVEGNSLKNLWRKDYDSFIKEDELVVSLLSSEFEEVFSKEVRANFIRIIFMEEREGVRKVHSTISKKARGKFLSHLVENKIENLNELRKIKFENYRYEEDLSTGEKLVFVDKIK